MTKIKHPAKRFTIDQTTSLGVRSSGRVFAVVTGLKKPIRALDLYDTKEVKLERGEQLWEVELKLVKKVSPVKV